MEAFRAKHYPPVLFSRNQRGIAGTLIWINFDRHGLLNLVSKMRGKFIANIDDIRPQFRGDDNAFLSQNAIFNATLVRDNGIPVDATIDQLGGQASTKSRASRKKRSRGIPTRSCPSTSRSRVRTRSARRPR